MRRGVLIAGACLLLAGALSGFLSGCATTRSVSVPEIETTVTIGGRKYVSARMLCQIYNLDYYWDPVSKKITLTKDDKTAKMMVDSSVALLDERVCTMDKEVQFYQGSAVIPYFFAQEVLGPFFIGEDIRRRARAGGLGLPVKTVIIDPGHGGKDPGAIGRRGLQEKDVVLDIAKKLKKKLNAAGIKVILTRDSDEFISLSQRSLIANAHSEEAEFFISIHANASRSRWVKGVEVLYLSEAIDEDLRSSKAAKNYDLNLRESYSGENTAAIIWDLIYRDDRKSSQNMAELICRSLSSSLSQRNRGIKPARFQVLKTNIPAVLIEVGFISNLAEEKKLRSSYYQNKIAQAIAQGVLQYNRNFTQERTVRR